jgi:hypothetical protein
MQIDWARPIYRNLERNLRPLPHRIVDNNNMANANVDQAAIAAAAAAAVAGAIQPQPSRVLPQKFSGTSVENAAFWLQCFNTYCDHSHVEGDARTGHFMLFLAGPAQNWYLTLPDAVKQNWAQLSAAFTNRFANVENNVAQEELFYAKNQAPNEKAADFINDMMSLGNKLGLNVPTMLSTIKRNLLPELRAYVISHNVADLTQLLQRAELFEQIQSWTKPQTKSVQFQTVADTNTTDAGLTNKLIQSNNEIKTIMSSLTNEFAKLHISAAQQHIDSQTRARSKSPVPSHLTSQQYTEEQYYTAPQQQEPPFCSRCLCYGHVAQQCRQQAMIPRQQYAQQQYRQYMPLQFHNTNRFPSYNNQQWQQKGYRYQNANFGNNARFRPNYQANWVLIGQRGMRPNNQVGLPRQRAIEYQQQYSRQQNRNQSFAAVDDLNE